MADLPSSGQPEGHVRTQLQKMPGDLLAHSVPTLSLPVHQGYCPRREDQAVYKNPCAGDHQCGWHEKCCRTGGHRKCVQAVPGRVSAGHGFPLTWRVSGERLTVQYVSPEKMRVLHLWGCHHHLLGHSKKMAAVGTDLTTAEIAAKRREAIQDPSWCGLNCVPPEGLHQHQDQNQDQDQDQDQNQDQNQNQNQDQKKDICHLPSDTGPCRAFMRRWFYDKHSGRCREFIYGGCQGNANNFEDVEECERRCGPPDNKPGTCPIVVQGEEVVCDKLCSSDASCPGPQRCCPTSCGKKCEIPQQLRSEVCQLPLEQGSCKQQLQRYFYDPDKKKCVSYRVCEASRRNFETRELCEKACGKISKGTEDQCCIEAPEVCKLPKDAGHCRGYSPQYYFNWETKRCEIFVYGLCGSNDNRFSTKLECQMVCGEFGAEALCPPTTPLFSSQSNSSSSSSSNNNKNNAPKNESLHNIPAWKHHLGSRCLHRGCHGHCPSCIPV
ncbi:hypothetical protein Chor_010491 [Crotalus horridus]